MKQQGELVEKTVLTGMPQAPGVWIRLAGSIMADHPADVAVQFESDGRGPAADGPLAVQFESDGRGPDSGVSRRAMWNEVCVVL